MKRFQFSMLTLLVAVTFVGLGCAALVNASPLWASVTISITAFALLAAVLGAAYGRSRARAMCGGFAIFGWGYLVLAATPVFDLEQLLLTGAANDLLYVTMHGASTPAPATYVTYAPQTAIFTPSTGQPQLATVADVSLSVTTPVTTFGYSSNPALILATPTVDHNAFDRVAHSLWALAAGVVGAIAAGWLHNRTSPSDVANMRSEPAP